MRNVRSISTTKIIGINDMEFKPFLKVLYRIYSVYFKSNILVSNMRCFIHSYIHARISICSVCVKRSLYAKDNASNPYLWKFADLIGKLWSSDISEENQFNQPYQMGIWERGFCMIFLISLNFKV